MKMAKLAQVCREFWRYKLRILGLSEEKVKATAPRFLESVRRYALCHAAISVQSKWVVFISRKLCLIAFEYYQPTNYSESLHLWHVVQHVMIDTNMCKTEHKSVLRYTDLKFPHNFSYIARVHMRYQPVLLLCCCAVCAQSDPKPKWRRDTAWSPNVVVRICGPRSAHTHIDADSFYCHRRRRRRRCHGHTQLQVRSRASVVNAVCVCVFLCMF